MNPPDLTELVPGLINASCPSAGVVTGGQVSPQHLENLARAGVRTVVDLRGADEPRGYDEPATVRAAGMDYVPLPIRHGLITDETVDRFREVMRDPARRPVLVHCATANRVGALLLAHLVLDEGKSPEEAIETAVGVGLRSREYADAALSYVRRHGGDIGA